MTIIAIIIAALGLLGFVAMAANAIQNHASKNDPADQEAQTPVKRSAIADMQCCGQHAVCEKKTLLAAMNTDIEYYEDEELDRFKGTAPDSYNEAAVDEFREVLYTMRPTEVEGWLHSLQLRGVELPDPLKDEAYMLIGDPQPASATLEKSADK